MSPREIRVENAVKALVLEQALAMARHLNRTADAAPDGKSVGERQFGKVKS